MVKIYLWAISQVLMWNPWGIWNDEPGPSVLFEKCFSRSGTGFRLKQERGWKGSFRQAIETVARLTSSKGAQRSNWQGWPSSQDDWAPSANATPATVPLPMKDSKAKSLIIPRLDISIYICIIYDRCIPHFFLSDPSPIIGNACHSLPNSVTNSLTPSRLVNLMPANDDAV